MGSDEKGVRVEELEIGDLIEVYWLDASEAKTALSIPDRAFDTPVRSVGVYGGIRGSRAKHLIIIKEEFDVGGAPEFHYNAIPLGMVDHIRLARRGFWSKRDVKKAMRLLDGFGTESELAASLGPRRAGPGPVAAEGEALDLDELLSLRGFWLRAVRKA